MKIALDATYSLGREPTGVAVYCSNLIRELVAAEPDSRFTLAYRMNRMAHALREPKPGPNVSRALLEEGAARLWAGGVDLFHGLNQRLPATRFRARVATFHDLFVLTADYSTPEFRERFARLAREAAERADELIAVSAFTADQASELLDFPRERTTVVHHGVRPMAEIPPAELQRFRAERDLERPFVLHVGAIQKRKNVARLVEAFEALPEDYLLVLAGAEGYGAAGILDRIESSSARTRIRRMGYTSAEVATRLYRSAAALAFPSLDEGFGLPALEAMSVGLPVVASNRSALPEVVGAAAVLVDPFDPAAIAAGLLSALQDSTLRARLIEAGKARAQGFTWPVAARKTLAVYRRLTAR